MPYFEDIYTDFGGEADLHLKHVIQHRTAVARRARRKQLAAASKKRGPGRPKGSKNKKRARRLTERQEFLATFSMEELRGEIQRRRRKEETPEQRKERLKRAKEAQAIRRDVCRHTKHAPKQRMQKSGRHNAGSWYCPSCKKTVPAPLARPISGDLEVVT